MRWLGFGRDRASRNRANHAIAHRAIAQSRNRAIAQSGTCRSQVRQRATQISGPGGVAEWHRRCICAERQEVT
jgi:hypothetical protein